MKLSNAPQSLPWPDLEWKLSTTISIILAYGFEVQDYIQVYQKQSYVMVKVNGVPDHTNIRIYPNRCEIELISHKTYTHSGRDWIQALAAALSHLKVLTSLPTTDQLWNRL